MSKSELEAQFALMWRTMGNGDKPQREYRFAASIGRKWRLDFAFIPQMVAVEIDGGQWASHGGRHNTDGDRDKMNHAAAFGWRVLRFSGSMLHDPEAVCKMVRWALADPQPCGHPRAAIGGNGTTHYCVMCESENDTPQA